MRGGADETAENPSERADALALFEARTLSLCGGRVAIDYPDCDWTWNKVNLNKVNRAR